MIWLLTIVIMGIMLFNIFAIYAVCCLDGIISDICEIYLEAVLCIFLIGVLLVFSYVVSYCILDRACEAKGNDSKYCEVVK